MATRSKQGCSELKLVDFLMLGWELTEEPERKTAETHVLIRKGISEISTKSFYSRGNSILVYSVSIGMCTSIQMPLCSVGGAGHSQCQLVCLAFKPQPMVPYCDGRNWGVREQWLTLAVRGKK